MSLVSAKNGKKWYGPLVGLLLLSLAVVGQRAHASNKKLTPSMARHTEYPFFDYCGFFNDMPTRGNCGRAELRS